MIKKECTWCGKAFEPPKSNKRKQCCSPTCAGKQAASGGLFKRRDHYYTWRNGKRIRIYGTRKIGTKRRNKDGYMLIWAGSSFKPEHRLVMEKYLGRKLIKGEVVHHRDGKKDNNEIENLQLLANSTHAFAIETQHSEDIHRLIMMIVDIIK